MCGEKNMRFWRPLFYHWITPACAGKSVLAAKEVKLVRDHPRVCGEKPSLLPPGAALMGSPPRMRGKVKSDICPRPRLGITPAYAGKSTVMQGFTKKYRDHPRVCGEKLLVCKKMFGDEGSPPRMRGKEACHIFFVPFGRITPAYAGKS